MPAPRWLADFNRTWTNRVTKPFAAHLPGFAVVLHVGRKSGREYQTPVNAFRRVHGYAFALTYGRGDWVHNVLHSGSFRVTTRGRTVTLTNPRVIEDRTHEGMPWPVRKILGFIAANDVLLADTIG